MNDINYDLIGEIEPEKIPGLYETGQIKGMYCDPKEIQEFMAALETPLFGVTAWELAGTGEGKLSLPYKVVMQYEPEFGRYEAQRTGDCHRSNLAVTTPYGNKKISDFNIGDLVITPQGNTRKVIDVIKKEYDGDIVKIFVEGYPEPIEATPDHKFLTYPNFTERYHDDIDREEILEKPIGEIEEGDYVLLPKGIDEDNCKIHVFDMKDYCKNKCITTKTRTTNTNLKPISQNGFIREINHNKEIREKIVLDEKLAWLIGLYLAEGGISIDGNTVTYSLGRHEAIIAEQIKEYIEEIFGLNARIYNMKSHPTATDVAVHSKVMAEFFKSIVPGNIKTKSVPNFFFTAYRNVRLSLLKGWIDGDGHIDIKRKNSEAISISKDLAIGMTEVCRSLGIQVNFYTRKRKYPRQEAYRLRFNDKGTCTIYQKNKIEFNIAKDLITQLGQAVKVKKIEKYKNPDKYVYCLNVDIDHEFIGNGYGLKNCVSHSSRNAGMLDYCMDVYHEGNEYQGRFATENIYGFRGHGGQGASCARLAKYVHKKYGIGGFLIRKAYSSGRDSVDLSIYNSNIGHNWGRLGTPSWLNAIAKLNPAETVSYVGTIEEARDAIANGYGVSVCSGQGFSSRRDENGVSSPKGGWQHAMCWTGCDDTDYAHRHYGGPLFLVTNSWGGWNSGPKRHDQPDGSFWIKSDIAKHMIGQQGSWVISSVVGFKRRDVDFILI